MTLSLCQSGGPASVYTCEPRRDRCLRSRAEDRDRLPGLREATFAADETSGDWDVNERLARPCLPVRGSLGFLATLPATGAQPNLFLAAIRDLAVCPAATASSVEIVRRKFGPIRDLKLGIRPTQTRRRWLGARSMLPLLACLPSSGHAWKSPHRRFLLASCPPAIGYDYGVAGSAVRTGTRAPLDVPRSAEPFRFRARCRSIAWRRGIDLARSMMHAKAERHRLEGAEFCPGRNGEPIGFARK